VEPPERPETAAAAHSGAEGHIERQRCDGGDGGGAKADNQITNAATLPDGQCTHGKNNKKYEPVRRYFCIVRSHERAACATARGRPALCRSDRRLSPSSSRSEVEGASAHASMRRPRSS
jgi:hypothetical protein